MITTQAQKLYASALFDGGTTVQRVFYCRFLLGPGADSVSRVSPSLIENSL